MEALSIADALRSAMWVTVLASMPILLIAMGMGLIMWIIQTATSIQEQTLAFIPKILAVIFALVAFGPWMFRVVGDMTIQMLGQLHRYVN